MFQLSKTYTDRIPKLYIFVELIFSESGQPHILHLTISPLIMQDNYMLLYAKQNTDRMLKFD